MRARARGVVLLVALLACAHSLVAQEPVQYRFSFPDRAHRIMDVEVTFTNVPAGPLQLRMSRTSPGRYALHEFAKNVFDVRAVGGDGRALRISRPDPYGWDVAGHDGRVRLTYRIFGDRTDGTYLGIDASHAHINMPAALVWARGMELRPATVQFEAPAGSGWRVATQLMPGGDEFTFTAPNLQYLIDSPSEMSAFALRMFTVAEGARRTTFRVAVHHDGTDAELDTFIRQVERVVLEARHVYGELPAFEGGTYTFIGDYLPWVNGDGMEHRNSTILTSPASIRSDMAGLVDTVSHEFFHVWNMERIRSKALEPFDLERVNQSSELWLGEGFTSYYGPLVQHRAGLMSLGDFIGEMGQAVNAVVTSPARSVRSLRGMSEHAPFVDAAVSVDRSLGENGYISYYTWGSVVGLGLDLTLRERSGGAVTLDHFMRALWQTHGKPGGRQAGYVDNPYTLDDLKTALTTVSGDAAFSRGFFERYVEGGEVMDFQTLLGRAGILLRPVSPGQVWAGAIRVQAAPGGLRLLGATPFGSPLYETGADRDDVLTTIDGRRLTAAGDLTAALQGRKAGDTVRVGFERRGQPVTGTMRLTADPRVEAVPAESAGQTVTAAQRTFRDAWLGSAGTRLERQAAP